MSRANPRYRRTNPPLPAVTNNVVMLTIIGSIESQLTINTLYYNDSGGVPAALSLTTFITAWDTNARTQMLACSSNEWILVQYKAQYMNAPTITPQYNTLTAGTVGTGGVGHEPTTVAGIMSKYSGVKGQHGRGRYFIPAIPTTAVVSSNMSSAYSTTVSAYATKLLGTVTAGALTYTPGIFSRLNYNKVSGAGGGFSPILTISVRPLLGTIRRRRIGRGK